jgi:hypothetical protein
MSDFQDATIDLNLARLETHGTPASLTRADGSTESFVGVFLSAYQDSRIRLAPDGGLSVSSTQPWIWVDLQVARPDDPDGNCNWVGAVPVQNDTITVGSDAYRVYDTEPDGFGGTKLILKKK